MGRGIPGAGDVVVGGSFDGVFIRGTCRRKTGGEEKGGRENFLFGFFTQEGFLFSLGKRRESRGNYQSRHADGSLSGGTLRRCRVRILDVKSPLGSSGRVLLLLLFADCHSWKLECIHSRSCIHVCSSLGYNFGQEIPRLTN